MRRCRGEKVNQEGLFQFPTVIGGVVLAVNIPGLKSGELVLDGKTLGDIYLGKSKWDDGNSRTKLNPSVKLPSQNIAVVRRADGSVPRWPLPVARRKSTTSGNRKWARVLP